MASECLEKQTLSAKFMKGSRINAGNSQKTVFFLVSRHLKYKPFLAFSMLYFTEE